MRLGSLSIAGRCDQLSDRWRAVPLILNVGQLPALFEPSPDNLETSSLVEFLRSIIALEGEQRKAPMRVVLGPFKQPGTDTGPLIVEMDIKLIDAPVRRGDETDDAPANQRDQHAIARYDRVKEVRTLLFNGVRFTRAYRRLETRSPHRDELVGVRRREIKEADLHGDIRWKSNAAIQRPHASARASARRSAATACYPTLLLRALATEANRGDHRGTQPSTRYRPCA